MNSAVQSEALELMGTLAARGVKLWLFDGRIRYRGPPGALSRELVEGIQRNKASIIEALEGEKDRMELEAHGPRFRPMAFAEKIPFNHRWDVWEHASRGRFCVDFLNVPAVYTIEGPFDVSAYREFIDLIVQRHDILRARMVVEEGNPCLTWTPSYEVTSQYIDASEEDPTDIQELITSLTWSPLDLAAQPWRTFLIKTKSNFIMGIVAHHLISDAHSKTMIMQEFELYLRSPGRNGLLGQAPKPPQYSDFSRAMDEWLASPRIERHLEYWRDRLRGMPGTSIPNDHEVDGEGSAIAEAVEFELDKDLCKKVAVRCSEQACTLPMALLAAQVVVLSDWLKSDDVTIWMHRDCRADERLAGIVGFMLDDIPYRIKLKPGSTPLEVLVAVRDTWMGAEDHSHIPVMTMKSIISDVGSDIRGPGFNFVPDHAQALDGSPATEPGPRLRPVALTPPERTGFGTDVPFCYSMHVSKRDEKISGLLVYSKDRYRRETIRRLALDITAAFSAIGGDEPFKSITRP